MKGSRAASKLPLPTLRVSDARSSPREALPENKCTQKLTISDPGIQPEPQPADAVTVQHNLQAQAREAFPHAEGLKSLASSEESPRSQWLGSTRAARLPGTACLGEYGISPPDRLHFPGSTSCVLLVEGVAITSRRSCVDFSSNCFMKVLCATIHLRIR